MSPGVQLPRGGEWLWTTRQGSEADLVEELTTAGAQPRSLGPALIASASRPQLGGRALEPTFARQGFPVFATLEGQPVERAARALADAVKQAVAGKGTSWALSTWVPDTDDGNRLAGAASKLEVNLLAAAEAIAPNFRMRLVKSAEQALATGGALAQVCVLAEGKLALGATLATHAQSLAPGGRARQKADPAAPSRAAMKLEEAFDWLGRAPEAGDTCVDLGAAPGGWTYVLLKRRATVIAVDPAKLAPSIAKDRRVVHVQVSAFDFAPDQPVDWLLGDMAWRPLEVAELLAKWGRRRWARFLLANIKLPMKQKHQILGRVRQTLVEDGGWQDVRARQLYHDRDEITLAGWRTS